MIVYMSRNFREPYKKVTRKIPWRNISNAALYDDITNKPFSVSLSVEILVWFSTDKILSQFNVLLKVLRFIVADYTEVVTVWMLECRFLWKFTYIMYVY